MDNPAALAELGGADRLALAIDLSGVRPPWRGSKRSHDVRVAEDSYRYQTNAWLREQLDGRRGPAVELVAIRRLLDQREKAGWL